MLTRKHMNALAEIAKDAGERLGDYNAWADRLIEDFSLQDNPRFDPDRFRKACGVIPCPSCGKRDEITLSMGYDACGRCKILLDLIEPGDGKSASYKACK